MRPWLNSSRLNRTKTNSLKPVICASKSLTGTVCAGLAKAVTTSIPATIDLAPTVHDALTVAHAGIAEAVSNR